MDFKNGFLGPAHQQMREFLAEKKHREFANVRRKGGGTKEQRRIKARIDAGLITPGVQGASRA